MKEMPLDMDELRRLMMKKKIIVLHKLRGQKLDDYYADENDTLSIHQIQDRTQTLWVATCDIPRDGALHRGGYGMDDLGGLLQVLYDNQGIIASIVDSCGKLILRPQR